MSHVDEGTLHAYLDGELPSSERVALEAHLAQCATCRAGLEEERALRARASTLLGSARPPERAIPPFEALRRAPRRLPWHVRTPFAWAASIALALGLGYYLRTPGAGGPATTNAPQPVIVAEDRAASVDRQKASAPAATVSEGRRRAPVPRPTEQVAHVNQPGDSGAANVSLRDEAQAAQAKPRIANAPESVAARLGRETLRLDAVTVTARGEPTAAPTPARAERERAAAQAPNVFIDGSVVQPLTAKTWPVIDRRVATLLLGDEAPVGLPGLSVRDFRRAPGNDGTIVVEQALDSSTVIQIFQRPASNAARPDSGYAFSRLFARFVGRLRVEIAGPVSVDSLNRLLEQVKPLP